MESTEDLDRTAPSIWVAPIGKGPARTDRVPRRKPARRCWLQNNRHPRSRANHPEVISHRAASSMSAPEEVTEMAANGEGRSRVLEPSTSPPSRHVQVAEMVIGKSQALGRTPRKDRW